MSILASFAHSQSTGFSFDTLFARHADLFDSVIQHREDYRLQILYTRIDRDENNAPHLTTYSFDADKYYYYCASTIKLPACALTLEKLNDLAQYRVDMLDSLGVDSIGCTELNPHSLMLGTPYSCLGHYIKEMLMISNNHAFNPVYDFLGQQYFQERLHQIGLNSAVISNRFAACDTTQNRLCDPLSLYDRHTHQMKYYQPCINNERRQFYNGDLDPQVGIGYLDAGNQLVNQPKDFRYVNYISLSDLHRFLTKIILPETQTTDERLNLTRRDYQYLYKCMGIFPRESAYPKLDSVHYPDNYMKYFVALDSGTYTMPDNIRIFNKVGQAYGFMTDCSYVADTLNKVEFFLSCSMYLNSDGILNDGIYEYDQTGFPFFHNLFNTIYSEELTRHKQYQARLQLPDFSDTLLVKPENLAWVKVDTSKTMPEIEAILCSLADSMWLDRRLYINYDNPNSDEIFYRNLSIALRNKKSIGYPFDALRQKEINILTSNDKHFSIFSWENQSRPSNSILFQFTDSNSKILVKKPSDFPDNKGLPKLKYTAIHDVQYSNFWIEDHQFSRWDSSMNMTVKCSIGVPWTTYLVLGNIPSDSAGAVYLQAYQPYWSYNTDITAEKEKIFRYSGQDYSDIIVAKRTGKEQITYDVKHKTITFPMIVKSGRKFKSRIVKLKFDGYIFK